MLYPDSEKRISELTMLAESFQRAGYPETAKEIREIGQILKGDKVPTDFQNKLNSLFVIHRGEFEGESPVGQNYRKRCFEEIAVTIFEAIGRLEQKSSQILPSIYPILTRLNDARNEIGGFASELEKNHITDKKVVFHLLCYMYLVYVEGIFDELAKILYFMKVVEKKDIQRSLRDVEKKTTKEILGSLKALKVTPIFLERWDAKNHIRNAIAHARAGYSAINGTVRFIDADKHGNVTWNSGDIPLSKFTEMALQLEDSLSAFLNIFRLLRVFYLMMANNLSS